MEKKMMKKLYFKFGSEEPVQLVEVEEGMTFKLELKATDVPDNGNGLSAITNAITFTSKEGSTFSLYFEK